MTTTAFDRVATSLAIEAELLALAVRKMVPHGTGAELARRHGVTRERVRQIAVRAGVRTKRLPRRVCRRCQTPTRAAGRVCRACLEPKPTTVHLVCEGCGGAFERERRKHLNNAKQARHYGRPVRTFCTPACAGRSIGRALTASA